MVQTYRDITSSVQDTDIVTHTIEGSAVHAVLLVIRLVSDCIGPFDLASGLKAVQNCISYFCLHFFLLSINLTLSSFRTVRI